MATNAAGTFLVLSPGREREFNSLTVTLRQKFTHTHYTRVIALFRAHTFDSYRSPGVTVSASRRRGVETKKPHSISLNSDYCKKLIIILILIIIIWSIISYLHRSPPKSIAYVRLGPRMPTAQATSCRAQNVSPVYLFIFRSGSDR